MKLAVYGKESLDVMQKLVEEKFSAIPDKSLTTPRFPTDPYGPEQLGKMLEVVPVRYLTRNFINNTIFKLFFCFFHHEMS